ncbi:hypothetical protein KIPB_015842, partial [Kipferlia bialata]
VTQTVASNDTRLAALEGVIDLKATATGLNEHVESTSERVQVLGTRIVEAEQSVRQHVESVALSLRGGLDSLKEQTAVQGDSLASLCDQNAALSDRQGRVEARCLTLEQDVRGLSTCPAAIEGVRDLMGEVKAEVNGRVTNMRRQLQSTQETVSANQDLLSHVLPIVESVANGNVLSMSEV